MQTLPSQSTEVLDTGLQQPLEAQETPESTTENTRTRVIETVVHTTESLSSRLAEQERMFEEGSLTVQDLEQLVADFCTYLTNKPKEDALGLTAKVESFYEQLKQLVANAISDERVGGTTNTETDRARKETLVKLVNNLSFKVFYFNKYRLDMVGSTTDSYSPVGG